MVSVWEWSTALKQEFILLLKLQKKGGICCARSNLVPLAESRSGMKRFAPPAKLLFPPCSGRQEPARMKKRKMNVRMCAKLPGVCNFVFWHYPAEWGREGGKVQSKGQKQGVSCPRLILWLWLDDKRGTSITLLWSGLARHDLLPILDYLRNGVM